MYSKKVFVFFVFIVLIGCSKNKCVKREIGQEIYLYEELGDIICKDEVLLNFLTENRNPLSPQHYFLSFSTHHLRKAFQYNSDSLYINNIINNLIDKGVFIDVMSIGTSNEIIFYIQRCDREIDNVNLAFIDAVIYNYKEDQIFKPDYAYHKVYSDSIVSDKLRLVYFSAQVGH